MGLRYRTSGLQKLHSLKMVEKVLRCIHSHYYKEICSYKQVPSIIVSFIIADLVLPVDMEYELPLLLGVIQCIKNIIPIFSQSGNQEEGMKGSFGETKKNKETTLSKEQLLKVI